MRVFAIITAIASAVLFPAAATAGEAPPASAAPASTSPAALYARLAKETGIRVALPADYRVTALPETPDLPWRFDRAWRRTDDAFEVRVMVRPLARMKIDYDDPHSAAPAPEHVHPLVFQSLIGQLSAPGSTTPTRFFKTEEARKRFNADWAALAAFAPDPAVKTRFRETLLLGLHKSRQGDVYALFLYNDPKVAKREMKRLLTAFRFRDLVSTDERRRDREKARRRREQFLREGGNGEQCIPPAEAQYVERKRPRP